MVNRKKRRVVADCLYADSDINPDQYYLSGLFVPDAFLSLKMGRKSIAVLSDLEIGRARKESKLTEILSLKAVNRSAAEWFEKSSATVAEQIAWLGNVYSIDTFRLPSYFPASIVEDLRVLNVDYEIAKGLIFKEREFKSVEEAALIRDGNKCSEAGFRAVAKILKDSTIKKGKIFYNGKVLTSERVKIAIQIACVEAGGIAQNTIVAGGDQACDPHCDGSGPLRANELIIVDIFPRIQKTGYHGDMTRTFLKGTASAEQRKLVKTVKEAHGNALLAVKAGVGGNKIHGSIVEHFKANDFSTGYQEGQPAGFIHGTGHGLGLAVHEPPRVNSSKNRLKAGQVITIEPGLYYPGVGGCRIEDVVYVTQDGSEMLSKFAYRWEIK